MKAKNITVVPCGWICVQPSGTKSGWFELPYTAAVDKSNSIEQFNASMAQGTYHVMRRDGEVKCVRYYIAEEDIK